MIEKYQPDYPRRFQDYDHAQRWSQDYMTWYNTSHHHSSLGGFTPEQVFTGDYIDLTKIRQSALDQAYKAHPERFIKGPPKAAQPPTSVSINPIPDDADQEVIEKGVNFPTLPRAMQNAI
ncbi:integrase core domain-containing protein [Marinomonas primoryensis]|uniref:integrase core domain-containing protein n=1 Tax=Marinomonas primoryensis TaxID=178399 RepID=UPI000DD36E18